MRGHEYKVKRNDEIRTTNHALMLSEAKNLWSNPKVPETDPRFFATLRMTLWND